MYSNPLYNEWILYTISYSVITLGLTNSMKIINLHPIIIVSFGSIIFFGQLLISSCLRTDCTQQSEVILISIIMLLLIISITLCIKSYLFGFLAFLQTHFLIGFNIIPICLEFVVGSNLLALHNDNTFGFNISFKFVLSSLFMLFCGTKLRSLFFALEIEFLHEVFQVANLMVYIIGTYLIALLYYSVLTSIIAYSIFVSVIISMTVIAIFKGKKKVHILTCIYILSHIIIKQIGYRTIFNYLVIFSYPVCGLVVMVWLFYGFLSYIQGQGATITTKMRYIDGKKILIYK